MQHNFDRMFGSINCTHTYWGNWPKAWHGSFKGEENNPSIVLETICDNNTFFGMLYMGTQEHWMTTTFWSVLIQIQPHERNVQSDLKRVKCQLVWCWKFFFKSLYNLVDRIYPDLSRFEKGIKQPISQIWYLKKGKKIWRRTLTGHLEFWSPHGDFEKLKLTCGIWMISLITS